MATTAAPGTVENHDAALASKVDNLNLGGDQREHAYEYDQHAQNHGHLNGHDEQDYHEEAPKSVRSPSVRAPSRLESQPSEYPRSQADAQSVRKSIAGSMRRDPDEYDHDQSRINPSRSYAKPIPIVTTYEPDHEPAPIQSRRASKVGSVKRSGSRAGSIRGDGPVEPGQVMSPERQSALQSRGVALQDNGSLPRDRSTTFDESSSARPRSQFGHRPEPVLQSVTEDGREGQYASGRDSRAGMLNRNGTVLSRAGTMGRNGTLSRGANGGTVGTRRGAFGRGAGASVGTQPEEVLGRDDIHTRAELSERILDDATLRRLSTMEKKDAKRLAKVIKAEGKAETKAVGSSIKELERLVKLQKEAAATERKSQLRLSKWTGKEHKARLRFLKEKERYERIEGELRNAENDYEERRDHAAGITSQVAEKTQDLDDLRGQKAADDREREVKLLALRNPAHS